MTVEALAVVAVAVVIGARSMVRRAARARRRRLFRATGSRLGLSHQTTDAHGTGRLVGEVDGLAVTVRDDLDSVTIVVDGRGAIPFELGARMAWQADDRAAPTELVRTGDRRFDEAVVVSGDSVLGAALLDLPTRALLELELREHTTLRAGTLARSLLAREIDGPERLEDAIRGLVALGRRLSLADGEASGRLRATASSDPLPPVRERCLALLIEGFPGTDDALSASRAAVEADASHAMQLMGATHLGDEGLPVLLALAAERRVERGVRLGAIERLADLGPPARVGPPLSELLSSPDGEVRSAAVAAVGRLRYQPALGRLMRLAWRDPDATALVALALGRLGGAEAECGLIDILKHGERAAKIAAARALGEIGTLRAVEPLLVPSRGLDGGVVEAARDAIRRIQSRAGVAEAGRLSVATPGELDGALSAPGEGGELSMLRTEDGALTIAPRPTGLLGGVELMSSEPAASDAE